MALGVYFKYKCKHCGRVEYYYSVTSGQRNWPDGYKRSCKKSKNGYHSWENMGTVKNRPKGYNHDHLNVL